MRRLLRGLLWPGTLRSPGLRGASPFLIPADQPLPYSWVLTNQLAVGPLPSSPAHWQQLESAGLRSCFSCCYPEEEGLCVPPAHWGRAGCPLPDHRGQEPLDLERLASALDAAEQLLQAEPPLYLHCMAGMQRSPLLAVGLTARLRQLSMLDALDWVRRCHPVAQPVFSHLELLERVLAR